MKAVNLVIGVVAILAAVMIINLTVVALPPEANSSGNCEYRNVVKNGEIDETITIPVPSGEEIQGFLESLDPEVQEMIISWASENPEQAETILGLFDFIDEIQIALDGKYHLNAIVWERNGCCDANTHFHWMGSVNISFIHYEDGIEFEVLTIDMEIDCLQFILHLKDITMENDQICVDSVMVNTILRGEMFLASEMETECLPLELDMWSHLLLKMEGGEITMLKIWLPSWFGLLVAEI